MVDRHVVGIVDVVAAGRKSHTARSDADLDPKQVLFDLLGRRVELADRGVAEPERHDPDLAVVRLLDAQYLVDVVAHAERQRNGIHCVAFGRNFENFAHETGFIGVYLPVHRYEPAFRGSVRSFDEGQRSGRAVEAVDTGVVADVDVLLVEHGHMRRPIEPGELFPGEGGRFFERFGIHHHEHAVVLECRAHGVFIAVLRDDIDHAVAEGHVLSYVAQLRPVHRLVCVVDDIAFGRDPGQRTVLGSHVAFVEYERAVRVVEGVQAVELHVLRDLLCPASRGGNRQRRLRRGVVRCGEDDPAVGFAHLGAPALGQRLYADRGRIFSGICHFDRFAGNDEYRRFGSGVGFSFVARREFEFQ